MAGKMKEKDSEVKAPSGNGDKLSAEGKEVPEAEKKAQAKISPIVPKRRKPKFKEDEFRSTEYSMMGIVEKGRKATPPFTKLVGMLLVLLFLFIVVSVGSYKYKQHKAAAVLRKKIEGMEKQIKVLDGKAEVAEGYVKFRSVLDALTWIDSAASMDPGNSERWSEVREKHVKLLQGSRAVKGADYVVPTAGIDMAFIPQGRFIMGRQQNEPGGHADEVPRRAIMLTYDFWMSRTEISNQQLKDSYPGHRTEPWSGYALEKPYQPAVLVDWHMATTFCLILTRKEERAKRIPENFEYRLPTEAEWEYACRAGTETAYYWGDTFGDAGALYCNILDFKTAKQFVWTGEKGMPADDGNIVTATVGSYKPNAFGLYDMTGNVWEWCWDWYNPSAYKDLPEVNPLQIVPIVTDVEKNAGYGTKYKVQSPSKIIRGGSWGNFPSECRSAARDSMLSETRNTGVGFRIVLAPKLSVISPVPVKSDDKKAD